jgi:hypothetical protein
MVEPRENEFEALKNAIERHSAQVQRAWKKAHTATESVRQVNLARKAKHSRSKPGSDS